MKYNYRQLLQSIVIANPKIKSFFTTDFPSNYKVQDLSLNQTEQNQVETALDIRRKYEFSFWEALMSTYNHCEDFSYRFLEETLHHNPLKSTREFYSDDVGRLIEYIESNQSKNIALLSKVTLTNGDIGHIPMIDFHIPVSPINQRTVKHVINIMSKQGGYIIESGKSYHFIGMAILTEDELINFLSKLILFSPIVDRNWVSHQLIERVCALRITKGEKDNIFIVEKTSF